MQQIVDHARANQLVMVPRCFMRASGSSAIRKRGTCWIRQLLHR